MEQAREVQGTLNNLNLSLLDRHSSHPKSCSNLWSQALEDLRWFRGSAIPAGLDDLNCGTLSRTGLSVLGKAQRSKKEKQLN